MRPIPLLAVPAVLIASSLAGCSGGAPSAPTLSGDARVTYRADAIALSPEDAARAVIEEADDESTFLLDPSVPGVSDIAPGKAFLLGGIALRKADKVEPKDGKVLVTTSSAAITDVIESGHLGYDGAVDFAKSAPKTTSHGGISPLSTPSVGVTGTVGRWSFALDQQTADDGTLVLSLTASINKKPDSMGGSGVDANMSVATVSATMRLRRPVLHGAVDVSSHVTQNADFATKALDGDVTVGWTMARPPNGTDPAFAEIVSLPAEVRVPFQVGWVPMFFKAEANFAMVFGLIGQATSAKGSFTFHFGGEDAHTSTGGAQSSDGHGSGSGSLGPDTEIQTLAGSAVGVVFQIPKLSVGLGVKGFDAAYYISVASRIDMRSSGALAGVVPCRQVEWQVGVSHGIEWKVLGLSGKVSQDLFDVSKGSVSVPEGRKCG